MQNQNNRITLKMKIPVNRVAECAIQDCIARLHVATEVIHNLTIWLVPAKTVGDGDGVGFGAFRLFRGRPQIWIAGMKPEVATTDDVHRQSIIEVFAHELAHYEQFRDGRRLQERGVGVRSRTLVKAMRIL